MKSRKPEPDLNNHKDLARSRAAKLLSVREQDIEEDLLAFLTENANDALLRARAGSGKTTALAIKAAFLVQDLGIDPEELMMLTFNNAAARSLEVRLREFDVPGPRVRTFHAFANRVVRSHFGDYRRAVFDETGPDAQLIQSLLSEAVDEVVNDRYYIFCASRMRMNYGRQKAFIQSIGRDALISAANFLRTRGYGMLNPMTDAWQEGGPIAGNAMKVVIGFEKRLRAAGLLDATGVLQAAAWTLEREIETGKHKASDAHGISRLFIDEFQDVSQPYVRLIDAIRSINGNTLVQGVGDDWQAINGFAGADLRYFHNVQQHLENPVQLDLLRNRRSGSDIVDWGNDIMIDAGYGGNAAISLDSNGTGRVAQGRLRKDGDIRMNASKLADLVDRALPEVALIARKWKVGAHSLRDIGKHTEAFLRQDGYKGKVTVITAHGSKGLEYDQVLLLDDGSFTTDHPSRPIMEDLVSEEESMREEICLKYVAGTRAKTSLTVVSVQ